jgi:hypothetical protein
MGTRTLFVALAVLLIGTSTAATAGDERTATRIFNVSRLVAQVRDASRGHFGPAVPAGCTDCFPDKDDEDSGLVVYEVMELLRTFVDTESWDRAGVAIVPIGKGHLVISQTPENLERVRMFLAWLEACVCRRVDMSVHWLVFGPGSVARLRATGSLDAVARGTLDDDEVEALLTEVAAPDNEHESGSLSSIGGKLVALRRTTIVSYVADYEVEVAQDSQIGDPVVGQGREGLEVHVRATPLADGSAVGLTVIGCAGRFRRPMPTVQLEAEELGTLDLPEFEIVRVSARAVVAAGRTMATGVWSPRGENDRRLCVLLLKPRDRRRVVKSPLVGVDFFDCGFLTSHTDESGIGRLFGEEPWDLPGWSALGLLSTSGSSPTVSSDGIIDLIMTVVAPESWEEDEATLLPTAFGGLLARNTPAVLDEIRELLGALERIALRGVQMDLRVFSVPGRAILENATKLAPGPRKDLGILDRLARDETVREIRRVALGGIENRWAACQAGVDVSFVSDHDAEVAQGARIADPLVGRIFDGLVANVRPMLSLDGREVTLELALRLSRVDPLFLMPPRRTGAAASGILHLPRQRVLRHEASVTFPRGGCRVIDAGTGMAEPGRRLLIVVSVR